MLLIMTYNTLDLFSNHSEASFLLTPQRLSFNAHGRYKLIHFIVDRIASGQYLLVLVYRRLEHLLLRNSLFTLNLMI